MNVTYTFRLETTNVEYNLAETIYVYFHEYHRHLLNYCMPQYSHCSMETSLFCNSEANRLPRALGDGRANKAMSPNWI